VEAKDPTGIKNLSTILNGWICLYFGEMFDNREDGIEGNRNEIQVTNCYDNVIGGARKIKIHRKFPFGFLIVSIKIGSFDNIKFLWQRTSSFTIKIMCSVVMGYNFDLTLHTHTGKTAALAPAGIHVLTSTIRPVQGCAQPHLAHSVAFFLGAGLQR
jgi:hypothetical protein